MKPGLRAALKDELRAAAGAAKRRALGDDERFLVVKGRYGLGNRIFFLLSAIVAARATHRRLVIDWNDGLYAPEGTNAFPLLFAAPSTIAVDDLPPGLNVLPMSWRGNLSASYYALVRELEIPERTSSRLLSVDISDLEIGAPCVVAEGTRFRPGVMKVPHRLPRRWRYLTQDALVSKLLREELTLSPRLHAQIDAFRSAHFSRPVIGVHVRYTDNLHAFNVDRRGMVFPEISIEAVAAQLARRPHCRVFVATDNRVILEQFQAAFPDVIAIDKWFAGGRQALHQAAKRKGVDTVQRAEEALVELGLLAACEHLVYDARSSFARLAATLHRGRQYDVAAENLERAGKEPSA